MTVLLLVIKASALLVMAAAADRALARRASAAVRHGLWTLTVGGLLALPLLAVARVPGISLPILPALEVVPAPVPDTPWVAGPPATIDRVAAAPPARRDVVPAPSIRVRDWPWKTLAMTIYLTGLLLLGGRVVAGHVAAYRFLRRARPIDGDDWQALLAECQSRLGLLEPVRLLRTTEPVPPMAVGLHRPSIVLCDAADGWAPDRRRAVLLHELAHIARRDCLTQALASLATALYWFHPGVWWAARRLQIEREYACDDRVIRAGAPAREYAGHLLDIAYTLGRLPIPAPGLTMARARQLEGRLLAVMDAARVRTSWGRTGRLAAAAGTLAVIVPLASITTTTRAAVVTPGETVLETWLDAVPSTTPPPATQPAAVAGEQSMSGTWEIQPAKEAGVVNLQLRQPHSSSGRSVPLSALEGLSASQMTAGGPVIFTLNRDAGTFRFTGTFTSGMGAGTYTFTPSPTFGAELAGRGVGQPSPADQHEMAKHDVGLALVDELRSQGYETPTVADLVKAGHHGVTTRYVGEMGRLGYRVGTVATLVTLRDHGVTPDYVDGLTAAGLPKLEADQLVRARDHGVTPEYARAMVDHGYASLGIDALINARDHGVTADYVSAMSGLGYAKLPLDALVNARDHGVTTDYVKAMAALGFSGVPLDALVNARDHGVTPDYAGGLRELGYQADLAALVRARDHGVTPDFVSGLKALGYDALPLDELILLRDHGVTPEKAKRANDRAGTRLPPDMLRSLAAGGRI